MLHVEALDHIVLNVTDVERALAWYCGRLGLTGERVEEWRAGTVPFPSVRIDGHTLIDLQESARSGENLNHFCLVVSAADLEAVRRSGEFEIVRDDPAQPLFGARGLATGVYVRDPDGNVVELRSYDG